MPKVSESSTKFAGIFRIKRRILRFLIEIPDSVNRDCLLERSVIQYWVENLKTKEKHFYELYL